MGLKKKTAYFEWLRLLSAAAVVMMHTAARDWNKISMAAEPWQTLTVFDSLVRWPVPVFVMITGAIFLPRKTELKTVLKRYIPRMVLTFLVWSGLYAWYQQGKGTAPEEVWRIFAAGQYHLWYLPYLCGVYLMLPFLQKITEDDGLTGQLLAVSLTVGSLLPWLAELAELLRPDWSPVLTSVKGHLNFTFFLDLLAALVLGHWLARREQSPMLRRVLYLLGLLSVVLTVVGTLHLSAWAGKPITLFWQHSAPTSLCSAAALFVFAKYHLTRIPRWAEELAGASFGVYLSHALVIDLLYDRQIHALMWDPVWSVPVLSVGIFLVCAAAAVLIRRVPLLGKYLA